MLTHVLTAARRHVSELDQVKEQVAYLKVWLGIVVVTDISLAEWLISSSESTASLTFFLALAGLVLLSAGIIRSASPDRAPY